MSGPVTVCLAAQDLDTVEDTSDYLSVLPGTKDNIYDQYNYIMFTLKMPFCIFRARQCLSCSSRSRNTVEDTIDYLSILPGTKDNIHGQYNYVLIFKMHFCIFRALQCLSCSSRSGNTVEDTSEYLSILPGTKDSVHDQCIELYGEGSFMCVSNYSATVGLWRRWVRPQTLWWL